MKYKNPSSPSELSHPPLPAGHSARLGIGAHWVCGAGAARTAALGSAIPTTRKRRSLGWETRGSGIAPAHWPFPPSQSLSAPKPHKDAD